MVDKPRHARAELEPSDEPGLADRNRKYEIAEHVRALRGHCEFLVHLQDEIRRSHGPAIGPSR